MHCGSTINGQLAAFSAMISWAIDAYEQAREKSHTPTKKDLTPCEASPWYYGVPGRNRTCDTRIRNP